MDAANRCFQKGEGTPTYKMLSFGITKEELAEWRNDCGQAKPCYNGAKESMTKSNFAYLASRFYKNYCPDLNPGIGGLITWMVESRAYSLAVGWVSGSNGCPLDAARAAAFWRTANIDFYSSMGKGPLRSATLTHIFDRFRFLFSKEAAAPPQGATGATPSGGHGARTRRCYFGRPILMGRPLY